MRGPFLRGASDERLLERLRVGDDTAFEALYDRHHRGILAFCRHMLGDHGEAEDALQQTFISALPALRKRGREMHVKAFLYAVARNRCLSILRARRDAVCLDDVQVSTDGLPAAVELRADLRELLADLQRLPEDQRAALVLAELGDLSHDDVAEVLGVRREKVKAIIFQGRENLMRWREARHTDCHEIREQLATLRGGSLRRTQLRKHLDECDGCRAFKLEVQRQRAAMAAVMPVAPSVALKGTVLAAALGGGGIAATAGGLGAGAGAAAGGGGLFGTLSTKVLMTAALAGGVGAGGYAAVEGVSLSPLPRNGKATQTAKPSASKQSKAPAAVTPLVGSGPSAPAAGGSATHAPKKATKPKARKPARRSAPKRTAAPVPVAAPVQHSTGAPGGNGTNGAAGTNGENGRDGKDGKNGTAGAAAPPPTAKEQRKSEAKTTEDQRRSQADQQEAQREQAAAEKEQSAQAESDQRKAAADQEEANRKAEAEARKNGQQSQAEQPPPGA